MQSPAAGLACLTVALVVGLLPQLARSGVTEWVGDNHAAARPVVAERAQPPSCIIQASGQPPMQERTTS